MAVRGARRVGQTTAGRTKRSPSPDLEPASSTALDRVARSVVHRVLRGLRFGRVELTEAWSGERLAFGRESGLTARIEVRSPRFYVDVARRRSVGLGESYAAGRWETDDLVAVMRVGAREIRRADRARRRAAPAQRPIEAVRGLPVLNTRRKARRNIAAHYDLGNELFEQFLDRETMMYSSARFETGEESLPDAQQARLNGVCERLELVGDDHLLEIGTGWGGMAIHAASRYGCRVTTTTISREQRDYAEAKVAAAGLGHLITVLCDDYRDLEGRFDKLVSLEMIEAVGWQYFDTYFQRCSELLEPHGLFFLQAIVIEDGAYEAEKHARSFANELIFPGGCLPSLEVIQRGLASKTDLRTIWLEDISPSYVLTLRRWAERFSAAATELEALGYDEAFRRLWKLWLAFSEAGFHEARIMDVQLLAAKPGWHGRLVRD